MSYDTMYLLTMDIYSHLLYYFRFFEALKFKSHIITFTLILLTKQ